MRLSENVQMQVELCEIPLCRRSRSVVDPACGAERGGTGAPEIPRNEAYIQVRCSDLPC